MKSVLYHVGPYYVGSKYGDFFCAECGRIDMILRFKGIADFCPKCIIVTLKDLCPTLKDFENVDNPEKWIEMFRFNEGFKEEW